MKIEKSVPDRKGQSSNIVANGAPELSGCDFSAEVDRAAYSIFYSSALVALQMAACPKLAVSKKSLSGNSAPLALRSCLGFQGVKKTQSWPAMAHLVILGKLR
jgi:hypothetical protein